MIGRAIDLPQCVAECPVDTPYRIQDTSVLPDIARFLPGIDAEISHAHFIQHIVDILNDRPQVFCHRLEGTGEQSDLIMTADIQLDLQVTAGDLICGPGHPLDRPQHLPENYDHNGQDQQKARQGEEQEQARRLDQGALRVGGVEAGHRPPSLVPGLKWVKKAGNIFSFLSGYLCLKSSSLGHQGPQLLQPVRVWHHIRQIEPGGLRAFTVPDNDPILIEQGGPHGIIIRTCGFYRRKGAQVHTGDHHTYDPSPVGDRRAIGHHHAISILIGLGDVGMSLSSGNAVGVLFRISLVGVIDMNGSIRCIHGDVKSVFFHIALKLVGLKHNAEHLDPGGVFHCISGGLYDKLFQIIGGGRQSSPWIKRALLQVSVAFFRDLAAVKSSYVVLDAQGRPLHCVKPALDLPAVELRD